MPDFAVSHLSFWQAHERPTGVNEGVRILSQQTVVRRLSCKCDRVGVSFSSISPAVENDEYERFRTRQDELLMIRSSCDENQIPTTRSTQSNSARTAYQRLQEEVSPP